MSAVMGQTSGPFGLHAADDFIQLVPVARPGGFQMVNFAANVGLLDDGEEFVQRFQEAGALAAQVGDVDAVVFGGGLGQGDEFGGVGVHVGGVDEGGGEAQRPFGHGLAHQVLHLRQFVGGGAAVVEAEDVGADAACADEGGDVGGDAAPRPGIAGSRRGCPIRCRTGCRPGALSWSL